MKKYILGVENVGARQRIQGVAALVAIPLMAHAAHELHFLRQAVGQPLLQAAVFIVAQDSIQLHQTQVGGPHDQLRRGRLKQVRGRKGRREGRREKGKEGRRE